MYDPFGMACLDFLKSGRDFKLVIHSSLIEPEEIPVSYFFRTFENMPEIEKTALKLCTGSVLDSGAGAGCHSEYLQGKGVDVTALDTSKLLAKVMTQRKIRKVVCDDFFNLSSDKHYDTLLFLMNGIGLASDLTGFASLLEKSKSLLKPGGQIIFDSADLIYMFTDDDGSVRIDLAADYHGVVEYRFEYIGRFGPWFKWLFIGNDLMEEMASRHGYRCEMIMEGENHNYLARLTLP